MNPFTEIADLRFEVLEELGSTFASLKLKVEEPTSADAYFYFGNQFCRVRLSNLDNMFVGFSFYDVADKSGKELKLSAYLHVCFPHDRDLRFPSFSSETTPQERRLACLRYYKTILERYFSFPLAGDFIWVEAYLDWEQTEKRLNSFLSNLYWKKDARVAPISNKQIAADPTWEADARALYKEINGKDFE
ncbi:MAG: hypothetical protein RLZZ519_3421 [Bacteroidota bacterium]|jgi:hypothetical protein